MKPKFAFIRESYGNRIGGIQGKILSLASFYADQGLFEPVLITNDIESSFSKAFSALNLDIYILPSKNKRKYLWLPSIVINGFFISRLVRKKNLVLISSHKLRESLMARIAKKKNKQKIKHVFRVHTHIDGRGHSVIKTRFLHILDSKTSKYVDHYIPISNVIKQELVSKSKINPDKVTVVYNGINRLGEPDELFDKKTPLSLKVAIVGELQKRKSQEDMIRAIAALKSISITIEAHFLGGNTYSNYKQLMLELADSLGVSNQIVFHGHVEREKIPETIREIPIVILNSMFEGVPTSLVEAMSLKKIVIGTDVGGTRELVQNGFNGFLYPHGNIDELSKILEELFSKPESHWNIMRENAFQTWKTTFRSDLMYEGFNGVISQLS